MEYVNESRGIKMNGNMTQAINQAIMAVIKTMHTALPAIVTKYDPKGPKIEAKPQIKRLYTDGTVLSIPPIVSVPVIFPRTSRFRLSYPLEAGDGVLLVFSERSLETWLARGEDVAPQDKRCYDLSDAIAIPGLWSFGKGSPVGSADEFEIEFDKFSLTSDGNDFILSNGSATIKTDGGKVDINNGNLTVE